MKVEEIARVAHEVNRAYCQALGDDSQLAWEQAPQWQRESAINGVRFHIDNPQAGPDHSHNAWLKDKVADGWKYGPVKDAAKKEHPCFVPYDRLPLDQQAKDYLFRGIVHALAPLEEERLHALINTPELDDFDKGVPLECAHQVARWGEAHDRSKSAENWYWLVGYLAGKALRASIKGEREKALHHTISSAAALRNWHRAIQQDTSGAGIGRDADLEAIEAPLAEFKR